MCQCSWELAGVVDVCEFDLLGDAGWLHLDRYDWMDYGLVEVGGSSKEFGRGWKICVWGLIIFFMKGVVIGVSRVVSLAPTDGMSVAWKSRWRILHTGRAVEERLVVWEVNITS